MMCLPLKRLQIKLPVKVLNLGKRIRKLSQMLAYPSLFLQAEMMDKQEVSTCTMQKVERSLKGNQDTVKEMGSVFSISQASLPSF
mmetsp:Transcript_16267/g.18425  ORF Transcript_16267/g.18425 Transcript_16267/m.18425 type:complete len:85 (+) Transcript_16267:569-823(+)